MGHPFAGFIAGLTQKKQDCSPSSSLGNHCNKRTHVDSQEVKARSEHSSTWGEEDTLTLNWRLGPEGISQLPWVQSEEPWSSWCLRTVCIWTSSLLVMYVCSPIIVTLYSFPDSQVIFHLLGMGGISCLHLASWLASSSYTVAS